MRIPYPVEMTPEHAERVNRNTAQAHQLQYVMDIQRLKKQNTLNRRLVRKTQDGTLGKETEEPEDAEDEDDHIQFGDNVTHVYNSEPQTTTTTQAAPVLAEAKSPSIWPLVLATALGAGGLGAGVMALLKPTATPTVIEQKGNDTDTKYQLDFSGKSEVING